MNEKDFEKCEICGADLIGIGPDSPLYCEKCIAEMEKLSMSPEKYKQYREIRETMGK
ncbi:hypothetical protein JXB11_02750 [Candidatus Woesearchaeota archaeon]|nr:hypothetical protein [Candidatus Woesearchaeota archaeon]